jgi:hypothetical protein
MVIVGARFRALAGARAALRAVRAAVSVPPGDAGVRPLGSTGYETPFEGFVVAGRFEDEDVPTVVRLLHANGGRVIERRRDLPRRLSARAPRICGRPSSR